MNKFLLFSVTLLLFIGTVFSQTHITIVENIVNSQTIYYNHASNIARSTNNDLVALYVSSKSAGGQIVFSKYDDSFLTWSPGVEISNGYQAHKAAITNDNNGGLFAAWQQKDVDGGKWGIYAVKYDGTNWGTPVMVSTVNDDNNEEAGIAVSSTGRVLVAWNTGDEWVLCSESDDDGQSWSLPDTLSSLDGVIGGGSTTSGRPYLATGGNGRVIVVWHEQPDGHADRETFINQYDGSGWGGEQLVGQLSDSIHSYQPAAVMDSDDNIIVILNNGSPNRALTMKKKAWDGASWPADPDTVVKLGYDANKPFAVVDDNDNLYVSFRMDMLADTTGLEDIGYVTSTDGGATWSEPVAINSPGIDAGYVTMATNVGPTGVDILFRESQPGTDDGDTLDVVYVSRELVTSIDDGNVGTITEFTLNQNYPNPFNPETQIGFTISTAGNYELAVYNVLGEKVRSIVNTKLAVGVYSKVWDGRNDAGVSMASGVYFSRLTGENLTMTKKMVLVR